MESFSVRTTLNQGDWRALMVAVGGQLAKAKLAKAGLLTRFGPALLWIALTAAYGVMMKLNPPLVRPPDVLLTVVLFGGTWWLHHFIQRRVYAPDEGGSFLGETQFDFEASGFRSKRTRSDSSHQWSLVRDLTSTNDHVFVWLDKFSAYVIPVRDLPAPMTATTAVARLREFMAATVAPPGDAEISTLQTPATQPDLAVAQPAPATFVTAPRVARELLAVLRLRFRGVVDGADLYGRDVSIILLGLLSFLVWAGLDRLNYHGDVDLFLYNFSETVVLALAVVMLAWLLSRLSRPRVELRRALLLMLGAAPFFVLLVWFGMRFDGIGAMVVYVIAIGATLRYLDSGMRTITGEKQLLAVAATLVGIFLMFYLSTQVYFSPSVWYNPEPDQERTEENWRQNEQLVYDQSARLDDAISKLAPRSAGTSNIFFVGFAGFEGERVFAEEIGLAAKRIGQRYGGGAHSVLLVNDRRDSAKYPLATTPALRHALNSLASRMDLDEDVLFLSLSSHGSEESISVTSELGYWRDLEAADLAEMLRESRIRWKVIVISACHAGSFIEHLRDENTIILTAAAADRTSFGCSDFNKLTYFGEAFYRDALPKAASLRAAFESARSAIEKREADEGRTPSLPQAHFGAALEQKLAAFEATSPR